MVPVKLDDDVLYTNFVDGGVDDKGQAVGEVLRDDPAVVKSLSDDGTVATLEISLPTGEKAIRENVSVSSSQKRGHFYPPPAKT